VGHAQATCCMLVMQSRSRCWHHIGSSKFFRQKLIYTPDSELEQFLKGYDAYVRDIKDEVFRISWYMRGGVSSYELFHVYSRDDRIIMNEIVKDNIELTKKSGLPIL